MYLLELAAALLTLSQEVLQVLNRTGSELWVGHISSNEREHIVCQYIGVRIRATLEMISNYT